MATEKLLTARDVAQRLNVSIGWVNNHTSGKHKPVLPSIKLGRSVRFRERAIEEFVQRCERLMAAGLPLQ